MRGFSIDKIKELERPDPDIKAGNMIGRFMLFYHKFKEQTPDDPLALMSPHYHFLLTWEEAQAIIDCFDATPTLHEDMQDISSKLSEQLKWQAKTLIPLEEYEAHQEKVVKKAFDLGFDGCPAGVA